MVTDSEAEAGDDDNMNTNLDMSRFLSRTMKRWVRYGLAFNTMFVLLNQLRLKPTQFGDPEYTTGGKAIPFYASVRAKLRIVKGGRLIQGNKTVGTKGVLSNIKNKIGHGSVPHESTGFKFYYDKPFKFMEVKEVKGEE